MADEATTASQVEALTKSLEELKKLFGLLSGESEKSEEEAGGDEKSSGGASSPGPLTANDIIREQVRRADEAFRSTIRWMVGAVAAVALVVFGSGPFLIDQNPFAARNWWVIGGIAAVAVGVAAVVFASSRVTEPEDASLGELDRTFSKLSSSEPMFPGKRNSMNDLHAILSGPDGPAHLGPGCRSVRDLIHKIGTLQGRRHEVAAGLAAAEVRHDVLQARVAAYKKDLQALDQQIKDLLGVAPHKDVPAELGGTGGVIAELLRSLMAKRRGLESEIAVAENSVRPEALAVRTQKSTLATIDAHLDTYDLHRLVVMSEAWVAEKRGVFRGARRILVLGAVFAFVGGSMYLSGVSSDDGEDGGDETGKSARTLSLPAILTIRATADVAALVPDECVDRPLDARYLSLEVPTPGSAFSVRVREPGCEGDLDITKDDATLTGSAPPVELEILEFD